MSAPSPTVLVIDDDTDLRDTLGELLSEEGYDAQTCENGQAALARLKGGLEPRLILLDLMMPVMNGWQFRQRQLQDEQLREIPVVVMTASRGLDDAPLKAEVLYKPVALGELLQAVERNLR